MAVDVRNRQGGGRRKKKKKEAGINQKDTHALLGVMPAMRGDGKQQHTLDLARMRPASQKNAVKAASQCASCCEISLLSHTSITITLLQAAHTWFWLDGITEQHVTTLGEPLNPPTSTLCNPETAGVVPTVALYKRWARGSKTGDPARPAGRPAKQDGGGSCRCWQSRRGGVRS